MVILWYFIGFSQPRKNTVWANWSFGSYSADVDLLYPPTHMLTEDSHNTGNLIH